MTEEQIIKNAEYHSLEIDKNYGSNCLPELLNDSIKMAKQLCEDIADLVDAIDNLAKEMTEVQE